MVLSRNAIRKEMERLNIIIHPEPKPDHMGPNSVDLHLGPTLKVFANEHGLSTKLLGTTGWPELREIPIGETGVVLLPGRLYLGSTLESVSCHNFVPYIDARSTAARIGLSAHLSAGRGDNGYCGQWTVEITVVHPIRVYAGDRLFQMTFMMIADKVPDTYHKQNFPRYTGQYQYAEGPQAPKKGM